MFQYNLAHHPFTRHGTFLTVSARTRSGLPRLMIATARDIPFIDLTTDQRPNEYYEIALFNGDAEIPYSWDALPWQLSLSAKNGGRTDIAFADDETLAFDCRGIPEIRLLPCHSACTLRTEADRVIEMVDYRGRCIQLARAGRGASLAIAESLTVDGKTGPFGDKPRTITVTGSASFSFALRFDECGKRWDTRLPSVTRLAAAQKQEWRQWRAKMPAVPGAYAEAAEMAWHLLWTLVAKPAGFYTRRPMLMSKGWMNMVWSWDNCFNALGVAAADPELAFDQLRLFFDRQAENGKLPEPISDSRVMYGYVKPPVYGWTIMKLIEILGAKRMKPFVAEAYGPVARLTEWWYAHRDADRDGMCEYHHGNDSGWDNATLFDQGFPTEGADLAAHLVLQTEGLAVMAGMLGKKKEAAQWKARSAKQLKTLLKLGVKNNRFISPKNFEKDEAPNRCLLNYIAMVLGRRLPQPLIDTVTADLSEGGPFLTEWGFATESPQSPKYKPAGYWRGPVWAPSTYLIFDGLVSAGKTGLAKTVAERFCNLCARNPGMWENYDALTGKGLECPGYSWTAAVFLLLAGWLEKEDEKKRKIQRN